MATLNASGLVTSDGSPIYSTGYGGIGAVFIGASTTSGASSLSGGSTVAGSTLRDLNVFSSDAAGSFAPIGSWSMVSSQARNPGLGGTWRTMNRVGNGATLNESSSYYPVSIWTRVA